MTAGIAVALEALKQGVWIAVSAYCALKKACKK